MKEVFKAMLWWSVPLIGWWVCVIRIATGQVNTGKYILGAILAIPFWTFISIIFYALILAI